MPTGSFDGVLLTSANAARLAGVLPALPVHAVGEATAAAARAQGASVADVGSGGVDALLATRPPGLRLLHLAGEERVEAAGPQQVTAVTVYRARPLQLPTAETVEGRVLLVHSPAAGRRVAEIACRRVTVRVAAISAAAAAACGTGWERIEAADQPSDPALLSLAAELCKD
jgi:uroporphyrinogen-III synthase